MLRLNSDLSLAVFCCLLSLSASCSMHEPIIPRGARQGPSQLKRTCSIFAYEDIKEVHKRRYLLQVGWLSGGQRFVVCLYSHCIS